MFSVAAECSKCGETLPRKQVLTVCTKCGGALLFRYDLVRFAERVSKSILKKREDSFWKFIMLLPISSSESVFDLDEKILLYLTGNIMKYFDFMEIKRNEISVLDRDAICFREIDK